MVTTASLLESYIVDLTEASQNDETHIIPTGQVISTCIEILLISEDNPYAENGCVIDGDELTKMVGRRSHKLLQRAVRKYILIWAGITIALAIWMLTLGLSL